jgi:hypothetical protein
VKLPPLLTTVPVAAPPDWTTPAPALPKVMDTRLPLDAASKVTPPSTLRPLITKPDPVMIPLGRFLSVTPAWVLAWLSQA